MKRLDTWPEQLATFLAKDDPGEWGKNDCCQFVATAIFVMTGVDVAAEFRGYDSEVGALRIISKFGSLEALVAETMAKFELPEIPPPLAQRGDVVWVGDQQALAIIGMNGQPVGAGRDGRVTADSWTRAWRV